MPAGGSMPAKSPRKPPRHVTEPAVRDEAVRSDEVFQAPAADLRVADIEDTSAQELSFQPECRYTMNDVGNVSATIDSFVGTDTCASLYLAEGDQTQSSECMRNIQIAQVGKEKEFFFWEYKTLA